MLKLTADKNQQFFCAKKLAKVAEIVILYYTNSTAKLEE
jgi:hypothetical protein